MIAIRSKVGKVLVVRDGGSVETDIDGLVYLEVDSPIETRTKFDCLVKGLKKGKGEPVSETTSKRSSCNNPEEACCWRY
jgi:hypothetical protein